MKTLMVLAFVSGASSGKDQKELLEKLTQSKTVIKATISIWLSKLKKKKNEWMTFNSREGAISLFYIDVLTFPKKMQVI